MRRFTQFFVHSCGLAAATCILATCLALCTVDPMSQYLYVWDLGARGSHPTRLVVGSDVLGIAVLSRSVKVRFPVTGTLLMLTAMLSLVAIGILAWRIVRLCSNKASP